MTPVEETFAQAMEAFTPASTLVAGISGGVDSMTLLELLRDTKRRVVVAHFNHQLRGAESDGDEEFVRNKAVRLGFEFRAGRGDVRSEAKGISIEMAARKLRHAFFAEAALENGADIVLAHHADDQIETVLMRARRGIEGYGSAGIREQSPSPADPRVRILRPLLTLRKNDLKTFAESRKIAFREDHSNTDLEIERNRVRHEVIPEMRRKLGAGIEAQFLQHIQAMRRTEDAAQQVARAWLEKNFYALPDKFRQDIIVMQLHRAKIPVGGGVIYSLVNQPAKPVMIRPGLTVTLDADGILQVKEETLPPIPVWINLQESEENEVAFAGVKLQWDFEFTASAELKESAGRICFDYGKVGNYALLRHPQEGDRVRLSGRESARSLMDVLGRNKIPREKRDRLVVATTEKGEVFWVEGLRITEDFKVTDKTYTALIWRWERK